MFKNLKKIVPGFSLSSTHASRYQSIKSARPGDLRVHFRLVSSRAEGKQGKRD